MEGLEMLDPEIRIPTDEDFALPPPLESDIERLIAKINKKVLLQTYV